MMQEERSPVRRNRSHISRGRPRVFIMEDLPAPRNSTRTTSSIERPRALQDRGGPEKGSVASRTEKMSSHVPESRGSARPDFNCTSGSNDVAARGTGAAVVISPSATEFEEEMTSARGTSERIYIVEWRILWRRIGCARETIDEVEDRVASLSREGEERKGCRSRKQFEGRMPSKYQMTPPKPRRLRNNRLLEEGKNL